MISAIEFKIALSQLKLKLRRLSYMARKLKDTHKAIARLTEFLEDSGWSVVIDMSTKAESECDPQTSTITINESRPLSVLWTMLHEAGHAQIFGIKDYHSSFGEIGKQHNVSNKRQTRRYHYQKLKEEMLAWETGLNLAKSLNIYVDEVKYEKHAAAAFMTYVHEASRHYYQQEAKRQFTEAGLDIKF